MGDKEDDKDKKDIKLWTWLEIIHEMFQNKPLYLVIKLDIKEGKRMISLHGIAPNLAWLNFVVDKTNPPSYTG